MPATQVSGRLYFLMYVALHLHCCCKCHFSPTAYCCLPVQAAHAPPPKQGNLRTNVDGDGPLDGGHGVEGQCVVSRVCVLIPIFEEGLPLVGHIKKVLARRHLQPWLTCTIDLAF